MTPDEKRIVEWLREDAALTRKDVSNMHQRKALTPLHTAQWEGMIEAKVNLANAIERGEWKR